MKVAILGTGEVGQSLGRAFLKLGHDVRMGSREAKNEKMAKWVKESGAKASGGTFAEAAKFGELIVLCTLGQANEAALKAAGVENLRGKILIDTTNPLDFSGGMPPKLQGGLGDSGGEQVQKIAAGAKVVKAFNTVGNTLMYQPKLGEIPTMFICGEDKEAKADVARLLKDFGWETADIGGIGVSHYLEAMCLVWVLFGANGGGWNHAFKLLR